MNTFETETVLRLAAAIGEQLDPSDGRWTVNADGIENGCYLDQLDRDSARTFPRRRLQVYRMWRSTRLEIAGCYPPDTPYGWPNHRITVAWERAETDPAKIAAEIARRLLPGYDETLARVVAQIAKLDGEHKAAVALAKELTAALPGARITKDSPHMTDRTVLVHWSGPAGNGEIRIGPGGADTVHIDLSSCPAAAARRVAALIGAFDAALTALEYQTEGVDR